MGTSYRGITAHLALAGDDAAGPAPYREYQGAVTESRRRLARGQTVPANTGPFNCHRTWRKDDQLTGARPFKGAA